MYCSNCGLKLHKTDHYCPKCGTAVVAPAERKHQQLQHDHLPHTREHSTPVGRRIAVVLYVLAYLAAVAAGVEVGLTVHQALSAPNPQASYVTCRDSVRVPYKTLGIRNPTSDPGHDAIMIDLACHNLGGNSYTNVVRNGSKWSAWEYGLAVFAGGAILIELIKGTLVYLVKGYFPGPGTLNRR